MDGVLNSRDNCIGIYNTNQLNSDGDLLGDLCDDDDDNDGVPDLMENDFDGDNYLNDSDNCPWVANSDQLDSDGDGVGDACPSVLTGACCFAPSCSEVSEAICTTSGGAYEGDGTKCTETNCTGEGACCDAQGSCTVVQSGTCTGTYLGDGTSCPAGAGCF